MQSYSPDSNGNLTGGSEIGLAVEILFHRRWSKTIVYGMLRSERWWRNRLYDLINEPTIEIRPENLWDGDLGGPIPIRYEIEMNIV